mgnify:CR=1 FL=1
MSHIKTTVNNIETLDGMISVDHFQLSTAQQTCLLCLPLFEGTIEKHKMTIFFASSLGDNDFTGEIPEAYTHLTNLSYLFANHFFQGITSIITEMQKNRDLRNNFLTGDLPPNLANLPSLRVLYLDQNFFTGAIPPSYVKLTNLLQLFVMLFKRCLKSK